MNVRTLYRKRIIPSECTHLKDDIIVEQNDEYIVTRWETLNPKTEFSHGCSCYFLQDGIKVSKMYRQDGSLLRWYCDIVDFEFREQDGSLTVTDLLADVVLYPDGRMEVVDLDELAEAMDKNLITKEQMTSCLRSLDHLLTLIYRDKFDRLQSCLDHLGL
ncbi:MAG: DUF402 domain-containing protein [Lachnospiraceae bacterium]|nr:DUF402 domain-containing protein [Lachnospiraceae bacterium]MCM1239204.1 DUF402 domain-containing protein [Lachnospiraceae bacterium]MCM1304864.1 DUF402 domain-containing protein [Butyrivibrio sp.]MCM1344450.1 DUF402 domain-containing protein [Muribaculaceae bacterium]MCM1412473.1 DUF402 domain-containing protein [Lachnospiraceae bacterium]